MNKYIKILAPALLLSAGMVVHATLQNVITVTTTADENGGGSACSLREAVQAVINKAAYGGCAPGSNTADNVIQLAHGTYTLTLGQIIVPEAVTIAGKDSNLPDVVNPYTNTKPSRLRPDDAGNGTTIVGTANQRLFQATAALNLRDVVLQSGGGQVTADAGNGGLVYSSSSLALDNVQLLNGNAAGNGGGIFLVNNGAALSLNLVQMTGNAAQGKGGAIAIQCDAGATPNPVHTVTVNSSYLASNTSVAGAGVLELCGDSNVTLSNSTVAQNTSAAGSAAIAYQVPSGHPGIGSKGVVSLSGITAIDNTNSALALNGISSVDIKGSILAFNSVADCVLGPDAIAVKSGNNSATTDAAASGCTLLFASGTGNQAVTGVVLTDEFESTADYHGGLTKNYLPALTSAFVLDKGVAIASCGQSDQRELKRRSGDYCDIGAVERLQLTASSDASDSNRNREAFIDVLSNDTFGEAATAPNHWHATTPVLLTDTAGGKCSWDADKKQVRVYNNGDITIEGFPIVCKYRAQDETDVGPVVTPSNETTITVNIANAAPRAVADTVVRPVGQGSVSINPLANDNDSGDGPNHPTQWATYPIYLASLPSLGVIDKQASVSGHCPDWTATNQKICYQPPLKYVADNSMSPFTDTFTYVAYDQDGKPSAVASVRVETDAPDPDKGETGAFDFAAALTLLLLAGRRLRRRPQL